MRRIPHTRWWMCRPPLVSTFPGHHETCARIIRALVRMKSQEARNPVRRRKPARWPSSPRKCVGNWMSMLTSARNRGTGAMV